MDSELKPCPFCGGDEISILMLGGSPEYSRAVCDSCYASSGRFTKEKAINAWNQRAERTCKVVRRDRDEYGEFAEYSCGHANVWQSWNEPKFCCWCGAKVVE